MKNIYLTTLLFVCCYFSRAQNYIGAPIGVYADSYAATTAIGSGGNVLVGNGGNWYLGGNITSADKGNDNTPNSAGRSETIVFSGAGTYSNAATSAGASGNIIDGYAGANNQSADFILPVGTGTTAYPVTIPAGAAATAAYFTGSGSTDNKDVNGSAGNTTTEYSPYIDMDNIPSGSYTFSYPSGFSSSPYSSVVESGNTSVAGTNSGTQYNLLSDVSPFNASGGSVTIPVSAAHTTTQVYFATSTNALPVHYAAELTAEEQKHSVLLSWATSTEINNKGFDIQRSNDGKHFTSVGYVASLATNGNSTKTLSYTYTDASPMHGTDYYRLIQTDLDGHTASSGIVSADFSGVNGGLGLYPNPAHGSITVSGLQVGSNVIIYSANGQLAKRFTATTASQKVDISELAAGVYFLKVVNEKSNESTSFIVR